MVEVVEEEQEQEVEEEDSLTATSSSPSTARPDLRVITLHIHQRWRTVWPARTALITDTSAHLGVTSLTSGTSRHRPTRSPLQLDLTREVTRGLTRVVTKEDLQEDSQEELTSVGGWAVATTAPATPATAPASAWWGSARRSTTTGPPAWSSHSQGLPRATTQT